MIFSKQSLYKSLCQSQKTFICLKKCFLSYVYPPPHHRSFLVIGFRLLIPAASFREELEPCFLNHTHTHTKPVTQQPNNPLMGFPPTQTSGLFCCAAVMSLRIQINLHENLAPWVIHSVLMVMGFSKKYFWISGIVY